MQQFQFSRVTNIDAALQKAAGANTAQQGAEIRFVAGGTTLLDLMKLDVEQPKHVVDINRLPLDKIEEQLGGGLRIGALVRNSDLAHHPAVARDYPVLSQALLSGASAQLRNMATTGGNLLQRTRCVYFRDAAMACNKRAPGSGCSAIDGYNRMLAILGTSLDCIATNPSDMNVALTALEAIIHLQSARGQRSLPIYDFFKLPGSTPHIENALQPGELVTHVSVRALPKGSRSCYLKLRDRASYEFALASAAIVLNVSGSKIHGARIAMGGVGTKPWRCLESEKALIGRPATPSTFASAAEAELRHAKPQSENGFKVELAKRCLVHALEMSLETV